MPIVIENLDPAIQEENLASQEYQQASNNKRLTTRERKRLMIISTQEQQHAGTLTKIKKRISSR